MMKNQLTNAARILLFSALSLTVVQLQMGAAVFTVTNTDDSGPGSLRQAILNANGAPGTDQIRFAIGSGAQTIRPVSNLPPVNDPAVLDATTQPGYSGKPLIELDGSLGPSGGLTLIAGNTTVRGFVINRFASTLGPTVGIVSQGPGRNIIQGNYIGTNVAGDAIFGTGQIMGYGIVVRNDGNLIKGNVLSGSSAGILLQNVQGNASNNVISDNLIGTDATGKVALGNTRMGVFSLTAGTGNRYERNVMSGNGEAGIYIDSDKNVLLGNFIGVDVTGKAALGNGLGVWLPLGASGNTIGGTAAGAGNIVAFNKATGVLIANNNSVGNIVRGNSIYENGRLGIDLAPGVTGDSVTPGVTPNDPGDGDTGPNQLQNFPVVHSALALPGILLAVVTLNSQPNTKYTLDFYASDAVDPSGNGQGERYLGSAEVTTDGSGNATNISIRMTCSIKLGEWVTATATDPAGNTSEFSVGVRSLL